MLKKQKHDCSHARSDHWQRKGCPWQWLAKPAPAGESRRHGFSFHDTVLSEGSEQELEYKHHLEANYCISGEGEVVNVVSGEAYPIRPGTLYALDKNDRHILRATKGELRLICIFYPALIGTEVHQPDGSYARPDERP